MPPEQTPSSSPRNYLKLLGIIHASLVLGPVLFGSFVYYQKEAIVTNFEMNGDPFLYLVPMVTLAGYFLSAFLFKKLLAKISITDALQKKLGTHQMASLLKYALLEGPAFLAIIAFMLNGIILYLLLAILLIAFLLSQRPSLEKLKQEIPMRQEEVHLFHDSNKSNKL